jgi:xanthine/uracil permease
MYRQKKFTEKAIVKSQILYFCIPKEGEMNILHKKQFDNDKRKLYFRSLVLLLSIFFKASQLVKHMVERLISRIASNSYALGS